TLLAGTTPLGTTTAAADGKWSFTVGGPGSLLASLADGRYAITASARFATGPSQASGSLPIVIDTTPPIIAAAPSTPRNAAGWHNSNVKAISTASDALSGLGSPSTGSYTFKDEGVGQSHVFTVKDMAGNTASATVDSVNIDKTDPKVTIDASPGDL